MPTAPPDLTDDQLEEMGNTNLFKTGIRPLVDDYLLKKSKEERNYGDYWSASSAGYCQRKVIFERLGVPKIEQESDARKQRVFTAGHIFHEWMQGITKEAGLSITQELELQDEDLMIRGHIDDLVLVRVDVAPYGVPENAPSQQVPEEERLILYDYKTVNSRSFMWAKKNGNAMSHYHRLQLGTYMYMMQPKGKKTLHLHEGQEIPMGVKEARILKIEKENLMMMEQQLVWTSELESDVLSYWNSLNDHWKKKTLPKCTCADHEGGFMAKEAYNGYFYNGEPCSIEYYNNWKKNKVKEKV